ncbi:copper chaperone PCu(A)C [Chitinibacter sp. FCG-7]|uniref:Copper chaperone PCu(A)C n=1 Tax=Chitinibacter mangrovi TaxID=3153927 RepID=A0AAU7FDC9_9NEIS
MLKQFMLASVLLASASLSLAHDYTIAHLNIHHPWARTTVNAARNAGVFMQIRSKQDDQLLQASSDLAERVEIHSMKVVDGIMQMRPLPQLEIKANSETHLAPGGYHIMLLGLKRALQEGEKFPLTLHFAKAGQSVVEVKVEPITYQASGSAHAGH